MRVTISTLFLVITGVSYVATQKCHLREVDLCSTTAVFHFQSNGVPEDDEKVTEWCEAVTEVRDCMRNFSNNCMSPLQKELAQLLTGGASSAEHELCIPGSEFRNNYLKHARCLSEGAQSESFKSDVRDLQVAIENVFEVEFKKRMPTFCCGARRFHQSTEDNAKRRCGEDAVDMLKLIMDMVFSEIPKTICQSFDPASETCQELLPPPGTPPKGSASKSQVSKLLDTIVSNL